MNECTQRDSQKTDSLIQYITIHCSHPNFILQKLEKDGINIYNIYPDAHKCYQYGKNIFMLKMLNYLHVSQLYLQPLLSALSLQAVFRAQFC